MRPQWLSKLSQSVNQARQHFQTAQPVLPTPGLHHFTYLQESERSRIHLRMDQDGSGMLMINASRVVHLNPTAVFMAYLTLKEFPTPVIINSIRTVFTVSRRQAQDDYTQFAQNLHELIRPDGACPVHDLDLEITAPFSAAITAPYRMDLALTYRCNNDCTHCYNARSRNFSELPTQAWITVLDRLWDQGIPHIVFTGGEPTLRDDLPELIAHAEKNGQITGINTNGRRLSNAAYVHQLVDAGLDHVQITLESHNPAVHDRMVAASGAWKQTIQGIRNVLATRLFVMTNTTMLQDNYMGLGETLNFLADLGIPTVGLNALIYAGKGRTVGKGLPEEELTDLLKLARQLTTAHEQKLIWYTPTQYCNFDPVELDLGVKGCTAALYNMCLEPNGDVLPCQSYYQPLGNILTDPWDRIWDHPLANHLRQRHYAPEKCKGCSFLAECGAGCPLTLDVASSFPLEFMHVRGVAP